MAAAVEQRQRLVGAVAELPGSAPLSAPLFGGRQPRVQSSMDKSSWTAANLTVFAAAGRGVKPFPPAGPCHMPNNRNAPINVSLLGPFPRGTCCTSWDLLNDTIADNGTDFNMSVFFDGRVLSVFLGLDCTSRKIVIRKKNINVTVNSFLGNLSGCLSKNIGKVLGEDTEVGLSMVQAIPPAKLACPTQIAPYVPPQPVPPPPPPPYTCCNASWSGGTCIPYVNATSVPPNCTHWHVIYPDKQNCVAAPECNQPPPPPPPPPVGPGGHAAADSFPNYRGQGLAVAVSEDICHKPTS